MRSRSGWLFILMMASLAGSACKKEINLAYNTKLHRVVLKIKPGDVLNWDNIDVAWKLQSPCDKKESRRCAIKDRLQGSVYSYKCLNGAYCDPEILLDEGPEIEDKTTAM